ncbi:MAG: hypothetical protein H6R00_1781 [Proteobacteria bacterium]|nr:hypothetical protein [Pseudomonadota bacterium]
MLKTSDNRLVYWLTGFALIWCLLPSKLVDMAIAPAWFAPNPECSSSDLLEEGVGALLLPWTIVVALIAAAVAFVLVRGRKPGAFKLDLGKTSMNIGITLVTLVVVLPLLADVALYLWQISVPQTVTSDCTGSADLVSIVMRRPILQVSPLVELILVFWLLHVRTRLLSRRMS